MHRWILVLMAAVLLTLPGRASQGAQVFYSVQELGDSQFVGAANNRGEWGTFVFAVPFFSGARASLQDPTPVLLEQPVDAVTTSPSGINDYGQIVGSVNFDSKERSGPRAALWQPGNGPALLLNQRLGFSAETQTQAMDISNTFGLAGVFTDKTEDRREHTFVKLQGRPLFVERERSFTLRLNDVGLAAGALLRPRTGEPNEGTESAATSLDPGTLSKTILNPSNVGTQGHSRSLILPVAWVPDGHRMKQRIIGGGKITGLALFVNNRGIVLAVGRPVNSPPGPGKVYAWIPNSGLRPDFLREVVPPVGVSFLSVTGFNDRNEMTGLAVRGDFETGETFPFVRQSNGELVDLQSAIPTIGFNLFEPMSLDNRGRILINADDVRNGGQKLLFLTPGAG